MYTRWFGMLRDWITPNSNREIIKRIDQLMAGLSDVKAAIAAEKEDLALLGGLITQLLAAFAAGTFSPADAQVLLDAITSDDSGVKASIASIQAALPPVPPPTAPTV